VLVLGAVSGLIFLGIIGFFAFQYLGSGLDRDTKAYVDEVVPIIAASWNSKELVNRASPELLRVASKERIETLFDVFSKRLGPLKEYRGSRGEAKILLTLQQGKVITGAYVADAVFEKGPATIQIRTIWRDDRWQILSFHVNSDAFLR
jgi:hypothetical protein